MVIKGSARSAPGELAHHLLREDTNEIVRVRGFHNVASLTLAEALAELDGMGAGSRCKRTLYHASINTPVDEQLNPEQQWIARERLAEELGLSKQPFVVVEHVKHGRQHTHIVWSRIDVETGKAIPDSHNYRKHEIVSRELEIEFGHQPVLGAHIRDKHLEERPGRGPSWGEQRQAERSGLTPNQVKSQVTNLWRHTTTGAEFTAALSDAGYTLARGDRRDFVLLDRTGEVHGLSRRIEGVKAAQVRERMAGVDVEQFPTVDQAKARLLQVQEPEPATGFVSAVERQRIEDGQAEERTRPAPLPFAGEAASAIHILSRTMGTAELGRVIVFEGRTRADKTWQQVLRESDSIEQRWEREAKREVSRGKEVTGPMPEAPQRASMKVENPGQAKHRPNAALFVQIFGWIVEHYRRVFEKTIKAAETDDPKAYKPQKPANDQKPVPAETERQRSLLDELRKELERPGIEDEYGFS